jgi:hypothetical protein
MTNLLTDYGTFVTDFIFKSENDQLVFGDKVWDTNTIVDQLARVHLYDNFKSILTFAGTVKTNFIDQVTLKHGGDFLTDYERCQSSYTTRRNAVEAKLSLLLGRVYWDLKHAHANRQVIAVIQRNKNNQPSYVFEYNCDCIYDANEMSTGEFNYYSNFGRDQIRLIFNQNCELYSIYINRSSIVRPYSGGAVYSLTGQRWTRTLNTIQTGALDIVTAYDQQYPGVLDLRFCTMNQMSNLDVLTLVKFNNVINFA